MFNYKKLFNSLEEKFSRSIADEMLMYIKNNLNTNMSSLEKAISIYLLLGDVLSYSPSFSLNNDYSYAIKTSEIDLVNNEIICKNWANLYVRLLKYFKINASVVKDGAHYRVMISLNNVLYSADATGYGSLNGFYSMSDIARIKFGFKIERFVVAGTVDPNDVNLFSKGYKELTDTIDMVYCKQSRKIFDNKKIGLLLDKMYCCIENNSHRVGLYTKDDINYRIKMINRFWNFNYKNGLLEKMQLFNKFFPAVFEWYEDHERKSYNLYAVIDGKTIIYKLIVVCIDDVCYYYLDDGEKFLEYSVLELIEEFKKRNVVLGNYVEIWGLEADSRIDEFKLSKMNK